MIGNVFGNRHWYQEMKRKVPAGSQEILLSSEAQGLVGTGRCAHCGFVLSMTESLIESNYCAGSNYHIIATDSSL